MEDFKERKNWFNELSLRDVSSDLYNTLKPSEINEKVEHMWNRFSRIHYITCSPFRIDDWKKYPEIYGILEKYKHTAEWRPLEILIWEYSDEVMAEILVKNNELKEQNESLWIQIEEQQKYVYMVWYYWWSLWRTIQAVIEVFKKTFKDKIITMKPECE